MLGSNVHDRAASSLLAAVSLFGMYGVYNRFVGLEFGVFSQFFTRSLLVAILVAIIFFLYKRSDWIAVNRKHFLLMIPWGLAGVVTGCMQFTAIQHLPIGTVIMVHYAGTIISGYVVGWFFFSEMINLKKTYALLCVGTGLSIIYFTSQTIGLNWFVTIGLIGGLANGFWNSYSKRFSTIYSVVQLLFIDALMKTLLVFPIVVIIGDAIPRISGSVPWIAILAFACTQILAVQFAIYGFKHLEAQVATIILPLEVVLASIYGYFFFGEVLPLSILTAGVLIILGFWVSHLSNTNVYGIRFLRRPW